MSTPTLTFQQIFEMGCDFGQSLRDQTLEDSRAVGRLLDRDIFDPLRVHINAVLKERGFDSFKDADYGIYQTKQILAAVFERYELDKEFGFDIDLTPEQQAIMKPWLDLHQKQIQQAADFFGGHTGPVTIKPNG